MMDLLKVENYRFTIIIPFYNTEARFFSECISSVSMLDHELLHKIIVVNDGSNELSGSKAKRIINDCTAIPKEKIKTISLEKNRGSAAARKEGFLSADKSDMDIVLFLDSDDIYPNSEVLNKLNSLFLLHKKISIIKYKGLCVTLEGEKFIEKKNANDNMECEEEIPLNTEGFLKNFHAERKNTYTSLCLYAVKANKFCAKEIWETLNIPYEDHYFLGVLLKQNFNALFINRCFYGYRLNVPQSTTTKIKKDKDAWLKVMQCDSQGFNSLKSYNAKTSPEANKIGIMFCLWIGLVYAPYNECRSKIKFFPSRTEIRNFMRKYHPYSGLRYLGVKIMLECSFLGKILRFLKPVKMK